MKIVKKKSSPYWRGSYLCIDPFCFNKFSCSIFYPPDENDEQSVKSFIFIDVEGLNKHKKALCRKIRCNGEQRTNQAKELLIESTCKVIAQNTLNNNITLNPLSKFLIEKKLFKNYLTFNI